MSPFAYHARTMRHITLHKPVGRTPLEAIEEWKRANPAYARVPACYAGRLDPMAEGLLLVLLGDECKRQERYRNLDKEYEIEVALDLSTDTGDALGMPSYADITTAPARRQVRHALRAETGRKRVPYPAFSSKTVAGKPLFLYALEGTLDAVSVPEHEEHVHSIKDLGTFAIDAGALRTRIMDLLSRAPRTNQPSKALGADFRQDAIRDAWTRLFDSMPDREFVILKLRVSCGSGTYMRTLAERIGKALGTEAFALSIRRTKIGKRVRVLGGTGFWIEGLG